MKNITNRKVKKVISMKLNDKIYDVLKWVALVCLPALATLISVVLPLWNIADEATVTAIVGTISAVDVFLGALLGVSTAQYNKDNQNK